MCAVLWIKLGDIFAVRQVFLQPQLSNELTTVTFEALYGMKCRIPLNWSETVLYPASIEDAEEQVRMVRSQLKEAQSRQKSYVDHHRKEMSFRGQ